MLAVSISNRWTQEIIFLVLFCSSTVRFSMEALNWCWSRGYWCWLPWSSWSHPLQSLWHWFHHPSWRPHCTTNPSAHHHTTSLGSGGPGYNHSWWRWLWVHWHCGLGCGSLNLLVIQQFPSKHQDKEDMPSNSFAISWDKIRNPLLLLMIDGDTTLFAIILFHPFSFKGSKPWIERRFASLKSKSEHIGLQWTIVYTWYSAAAAATPDQLSNLGSCWGTNILFNELLQDTRFGYRFHNQMGYKWMFKIKEQFK
jgi:hypothetical protein